MLKRISANQPDLERALAALAKIEKAEERRDIAIAKAAEDFENRKHAADLAAGKSLAKVVERGETSTSIADLAGLDVATVRRLVKLGEGAGASTAQAVSRGKTTGPDRNSDRESSTQASSSAAPASSSDAVPDSTAAGE
ncbi:hypothetical protein [Rhodococcus artemisiae]|uniref:Uncharacterized protein n=1 Tax=Rhodococcus artemisiae TaxID=714159 RepID=A0ABU7LKH8_9NOCA|nr:hypothetical protein [Rhodococcus artemisiae]MEE2061747.1 hypothetical protein [Rhodococcus artemisiae]